MTALIIVAAVVGYLFGWAATARFAARRSMDSEAAVALANIEREARHYIYEDRQKVIDRKITERGGLLMPYQRSFAITIGTMLGGVWPAYWLILPILAGFRLFTRGWVSPLEREVLGQVQDRRELEELRKLARAHRLALPEIKETR